MIKVMHDNFIDHKLASEPDIEPEHEKDYNKYKKKYFLKSISTRRYKSVNFICGLTF